MINSSVSQRSSESAEAIEKVAMAWAVRIDRGPLSPGEQAELEAWTAQNIRHAGAFARARASSSYFDRAAALGQDFDPGEHRLPVAHSRRHILVAGAGAMAASLLGVAGFIGFSRWSRVATAKGDVRRVALAEGSAITLNTDSAIEPRLDKTIRRIRLLQGEALFEVAKDPLRPFVVLANDVQVRAIGTAFTVRLKEQGDVAVMVREGVVEVLRATRQLRLAAGFSTLSTASDPMTARPVSDVDIERALTWRSGMLDLTGLSLAEASTEFARYSDQRILIDDPRVGALKVTGVYSTSDPKGFARAVALSLGLSIADAADGIRIGPAERL